MGGIKDYLISITAAAMIAGIITGIAKKSGGISSIMKLLCGLFLTVTVLHPVAGISFNRIQLYLDQMSVDADFAANIGNDAANKEMKQYITERSCAYILEKANALGASLDIEIILEDLIPCAVEISGPVSPYAKQQLSNYIEENLGISLEDQRWIG